MDYVLLGCALELRTVRSRYRVWAGVRNVVPRAEEGVRGLQFTEEVDHRSLQPLQLAALIRFCQFSPSFFIS
jgi:hypothetical protein